MDDTCPHCGAPKANAPECPKCGVIYAKAHTIAAPAVTIQEEVRPPNAEDARDERRLVAWGLPVALVLARLVVASQFGHSLARVFLTMWVHETGHAVTAWLCGYGAFPSLWFTPVSAERMPLLTVLLAGGLGFGAYWTWRTERRGWSVTLGALLVLQLALTLGLSPRSAQALIAFGGDGGCFVLGACLMATLFAKPGTALHRGWIRWGLLVIGAFAFCDALATWFAARTDADAIPFGEQERAGLSDPSKLVEVYGWSIHQMVTRYLLLAAISLATLAGGYAIRLRQLRARGTADPTAAIG